MKTLWIILTLTCIGFAHKPQLYIFYDPECPICQAYTGRLQQLYEKYNDKVEFLLVYPTKGVTRSSIKSFQKEYKLSLPFKIDKEHTLVDKCDAHTTPEIYVIDSYQKVIYKGAIDDQFFELGKARIKPVDKYLEGVLEALINHQPIPIKETKAIGCMINRKRK